MKNKTTKNLIILGAIIIFFALTNSTQAYCKHYAFSNDTVGDCVDEQTYLQDYYQQSGWYYPNNYNNNVYSSNNSQTTKPTTSVVNNYYYSTPATSKVATVTKTTTENNSIDRINTNTTNNTGNNNLGASAYNGYNGYNGQSTDNGITALSLRGSGSFMPSSIWQWILVVIFILAIIVISRMLMHKPEPVQESHGASHAH